LRRFDPSEATREASAGCNAALHANHKGIVAAGIEDDDAQTLRRLKRFNHSLERNRFVFCVKFSGQPGVDWHHVILITDLDTVAGIK
jgi:hypothetical protein